MEEIQEVLKLNYLCEKHKKIGVIFISVTKEDLNPFYCSTCMIRRNIQNIKLLELEDVLKSNETQPIYNWPPGILEEHIEFLENKQTGLIEDKLREDIMTFYDTLQSQVHAVINESRKQQICELEKTKFGSKEVIEFYNEQFKRNKLTEIFKNLNAESEGSYKQLLNQMIQSSPKDLKQLELMIQEKKGSERKFREFQDLHISELQKKIITVIEKLTLSLFNSTENTNLFEQYNFKRSNDKLQIASTENSEKRIEQKQYLPPKNQKIFEQEDKMFLCYDDAPFDVDYFTNFTTEITNTEEKKGRVESRSYIKQNEKQKLKLTLYSLKDLKNFHFGFSCYNSKLEITKNYLFKKLWEEVIKLIEVSEEEFDEFMFWLSFDFSNCEFKLTSNCFFEEKTLELQRYDESEFEISLIFNLAEDFERFKISEYTQSN